MNNYKKTPTIFQMEATECGAASLSMIFGYFGKFLPLEQMRIETGVSRDGCNAGNIMRAAKRYGLECRGFRREIDALREIEYEDIKRACRLLYVTAVLSLILFGGLKLLFLVVI